MSGLKRFWSAWLYTYTCRYIFTKSSIETTIQNVMLDLPDHCYNCVVSFAVHFQIHCNISAMSASNGFIVMLLDATKSLKEWNLFKKFSLVYLMDSPYPSLYDEDGETRTIFKSCFWPALKRFVSIISL